MRIDLHIHTQGSDGIGRPSEIAEAAVRAGLEGIAITDHHRTRTKAGEQVAEACRARGLLVVRGAEYSAAEGHVLVFGVAMEDLAFGFYAPMQTVIQRAWEAGGVAIPAHPYHGYRSCLGSGLAALSGLVAVETFNGQVETRSPEENWMARVAAQAMGLPGVGGSDAHFPLAVGRCFTHFQGQFLDARQVVAALRGGQGFLACARVLDKSAILKQNKRYGRAILSKKKAS